MKIIQTSDLAVGYGKKTVVKNVIVEAMTGQMVCLLGPNGSGKTTILRTITRLLAATKGTVFIKAKDINKLAQSEIAKMLSVVLTERPAPGMLTAFELASIGRYPHTKFLGRLTPKDIKITMDALRLVNAADLSTRYFNELSDGEKQKVLLARALVQEPELIVLDEPTMHLDLRHKIEIIAILKKLCRDQGITVILSLHDVDLAVKSSDIVILVKDGMILDYGPPEVVIKEDIIEKLYDISSARYNNLLGTIEMSNNFGEMLFVVGGNKSAAKLYRSLAKNGYGICTGVLHENDLDLAVAESMGLTTIAEKAFETIKKETFIKAVEHLREINVVIDTGFSIGENNKMNVELIIEAVKAQKTVFSLRSKKEIQDVFGKYAANINPSQHIQKIVGNIHTLFKKGAKEGGAFC